MHPIASCRDWSMAEYVCSAGPGGRNFEERHETFTIAAVVEGTFHYKTDTGTALMHPGSWLLGNHAECFVCGHDHSRGDRCIAVHISPQYFAEVSSSHGGTARFRFASPVLPAKARGLSLLARARSIAAHSDGLEIDEAVTGIIEMVVGQTSGEQPMRQQVSARDERRISGVLHHLEDRFTDVLNLDDLSSQAAMSKYHFLRTFRSVVGRSPHQYLLDLRLQHVAHRMTNSADTITHIALSCGFGDLSTFVSHFKRQYGESPSRFRARYRRTAAG
jgi:AraC family transcriptional regulator